MLERDPRSRRFVQAIGSSVLVYMSALVGVQLTELGGARLWGTVLVHAALVIVLVPVLYLVGSLGDHRDSQWVEHRHDVLHRAEHEATKVTAHTHGDMAELCGDAPGQVPYVPHRALAVIEAEIGALLRTLEASQGPIRVPRGLVEFQVTFMARSYADGRLTIAAWANRWNRRPTSLDLRPTNPEIYERSVTADVYRSDRPSPRLIESTAESGQDYRELYVGEKKWIKSTIVYPVLDRATKLVGTLVATCDRERYFRERDYEFWCELMEPFALRIALEKQRLDETVLLARDEGLPLGVMPPPF